MKRIAFFSISILLAIISFPKIGTTQTFPVVEFFDRTNEKGNPYCYFIQPLATNLTFTGEFDDSLMPVVEICKLNNGTCQNPPIAQFPFGGENGVRLINDYSGIHYQLNWKPNDYKLELNGLYQIRVFVDGLLMGFETVLYEGNPAQKLENIIVVLQNIVDNNQGTSLVDKVEDALASAKTVLEELYKTPPDKLAAIGNIEGVVGDLEAAVKDGLFDPYEDGINLMDQLTLIARQLAIDGIYGAIANKGKSDEIKTAKRSLVKGDAYRNSESFKDAVNKYKDALSKGYLGELTIPIKFRLEKGCTDWGVIGPEGGIFEFLDEIIFNIPPNALNEYVAIGIFSLPTANLQTLLDNKPFRSSDKSVLVDSPPSQMD